jgi:hypothetical protein
MRPMTRGPVGGVVGWVEDEGRSSMEKFQLLGWSKQPWIHSLQFSTEEDVVLDLAHG